jgi:ferric-dicitrate binding protein FerR (iron transport regulator)
MKMNLDKVLSEIREQEPAAAEIEQAAANVRRRLFPAEEANAAGSAGAIRNCAGFVSLLPASLAGSLDPARQMLLDVHVRECVECRRALDRLRNAANKVVVIPAPVGRRVNYQPWAIAAAVVMAVGAAGYWGVYEFPALMGGPRATVERIDGALYRVTDGSLVPVAQGAELSENDFVRTAKNSTAILRLNDGSKVEMNQRAQVSVSRNWTGSTVHLGLGSIIVAAAKQRRGSLQVVTADCHVSVKGTVFSVDAGTKGSRVAVAEGTVCVDHGTRHDVLQKGDQTATSPEVTATPIAQEFSWSQNSVEYLALLGDFAAVARSITAIPASGLRYQSKLLSYLPADTVAVAAIPNIGGTIGEANRIFQQKLAENGTLAAWWNRLSDTQRQNFNDVMQQLETASQYLGNEIVVYSNSFRSSPVFLAEETRPGLDTYLKGQLNPDDVSHMKFDNGLFVVGDTPVTPAGGFTGTALYQKLAPEYQQGAGWLFAADLSSIAGTLPSVTGMQDARYFVATSKTLGAGVDATENHASVIFSKDRTGIASWLAVPGPMGSLSFVSPDAGFAVSTILKNPALIVDDLTKTMSQMADKPVALTDLAGAFAGEVTIALDGPLLPVPSWKIVAEVYDSGRIQSAFSRLVSDYNASPNHDRTGDLALTQDAAGGYSYYRLKFDKLPWEADWAYANGYWVAAASHELVSRAIQNWQTGYTLPKSQNFQSRLSHDGNTNFSAVMYHNMGQTLTPLLGLLNGLNITPDQQKSIDSLKQGDTPGIIGFWAAPDRIDMAAKGTVFGMDVPALLTLQSGGPLNMMKAATAK